MNIDACYSSNLLSCWLSLLLTVASAQAEKILDDSGEAGWEKRTPNIIVIMADDMGFSDLGCYGSEIKTPNLDRLAKQGLRFTQFYNEGVCVPSRVSLLTGLYPGRVGRSLSNRCVTFAEVLGSAGYRTFHTGKWMVGTRREMWPVSRGFDRSFSCPEGGGFYFRPSSFYAQRRVVRDSEVLYDMQNDPPAGWYSTDAWTEEGIEFLRESVDMKKPFLWYLAYNAPHWPLKAKPEDIAGYRGKYRIGWDKTRQRRYDKLVELGIVDRNCKLSPREKGIPDWDSLSDAQKDMQDLRMATYAGMIDCMDQNIGKIVKSLKKLGVYENTLILFLSDNGGSSEGGITGSNKGKGTCGTADSFVYYGACWANVSDTPFRKYKRWIYEGGVATPFIAHWPAGISANRHGKLVTEVTHLIDLMATCVDLSGAQYPETFKGNRIAPMDGKSLRPLFEGKEFRRENPIYFNLDGSRAMRKNKWKLISVKSGQWELYDMQADRSELNNLAAEFPEKAKEFSELWMSLPVKKF